MGLEKGKYLGLALLVAGAALLFLASSHTAHTGTLPKSVTKYLIGRNEIKVSVEGVKYCKEIPIKHTCDVPNPIPPTIRWNEVDGARSFAIIVIDPDAPLGPFYHLVVYNLRRTSWPPGGTFGKNSAGFLGWFPVCPPKGDKPHRYFFIVLAIDKATKLPEGLTADQLLKAIRNDVIAYGYTCGVYVRK